MTIGAVVHAVVDQEASTPQIKKKKMEESTKGKNNNEAKKEKKKKFLKISLMSKLASASLALRGQSYQTQQPACEHCRWMHLVLRACSDFDAAPACNRNVVVGTCSAG